MILASIKWSDYSSLLIIAICVVIVVRFLSAISFDNIAREKGYRGYFFHCLLFGFVGWLMVIALPDRGKKDDET